MNPIIAAVAPVAVLAAAVPASMLHKKIKQNQRYRETCGKINWTPVFEFTNPVTKTVWTTN
jgi:hypothetical protein